MFQCVHTLKDNYKEICYEHKFSGIAVQYLAQELQKEEQQKWIWKRKGLAIG
jgi:hypothetical protein